MQTADDVLTFWFIDHDRSHWFGGGPAFDAELTEKFADTHAAVARGEAWRWRSTPDGRLAEIIVLDQFSRQIHRGDGKAFAFDPMALVLAQEAVAGGHDLAVEHGRRMFFYLPYMHSESLVIHEECLRLHQALGIEEGIQYELAHQEVLRRFGRYPRRNEPLGRISTPEEVAYCASEEGRW
ncbi:DUF924 family protein [Devosia sp. CN2-171]|uniref:DUF924 family protein n=1 Tax=Devosia sp. CN2-171 TaxID=3400909 RepID=UPI003BF88AE7